MPCLKIYCQLFNLYLRQLNVRLFVLAVVIEISLQLGWWVKHEISWVVCTVCVSASAISVIPDEGSLEYTVAEATSFSNELWII